MKVQTAAEATVDALLTNGVDTIYGVPGVHNDPLFDAFYAAGKQLRVLHARHEQTGGYMALGAALATGRPQVFSVVPGPGALNASAALLTATSLGAPVVALVGQIPEADIDRGLGHLHEMRDQIGLLRHITKSAERISAAHEAPGVVSRAFTTAINGRPGATVIECAIDRWNASGPVAPAGPAGKTHPPVDRKKVEALAELIRSSARPMIFVGGGARDAGPEVIELAELIEAPIASFRTGRDVVASNHRLAINYPMAHRMWKDVDLVIGIGTRLLPQQQVWGTSGLKVARIDIDPTEPGRLRAPDAAVIGDAAEVLRALVDCLQGKLGPRPDRANEIAEMRAWMDQRLEQLEPQRSYLRAIRAALPDDGILIDDVTQVEFAGRLAWETSGVPRTYFSPGYQDNLGWAYGVALGAKAAAPHRAVVCVAGDGGFMYQAQELATAAAHGIAAIVVVFDNGMFGNVKLIQQLSYGSRHIAVELANPDFVKFAESFDIDAYRAASPSELEDALKTAIQRDRPALIHVPVGDMPSPWDMILMPPVR